MFYSWKPYQSVDERKKEAEKTIKKLQKKGKILDPVRIEGRIIAKTFWGKSWCKHLESFSDYDTRLPRGRSYARCGAIIDLKLEQGKITALVQGSEMYDITINIEQVDQQKWQNIIQKCTGEISSVIELLQGKISENVMGIITDKTNGLFPDLSNIKMKCDCYDWAKMCKHIAAVFYGIGARLDEKPELIFTLRGVDYKELISSSTINFKSTKQAKGKVVEDQDLASLFGIDIEDSIVKTSKKAKNKKKNS